MPEMFALEGLFTVSNLFTLLMLVFLQAVLGFDNLLYISIESKRVPEERRQYVRRLGIGLAIAFRIVLLFVVIQAIELFQQPFAQLHLKTPAFLHGVMGEGMSEHFFEADLSVHAVIVLLGGAFILWTAIKEIMHLLSIDDLAHEGQGGAQRTVAGAIGMIVAMNLVFSFDSILSAIALTEIFLVMATAIVISGVLMLVLADRVATFLEKNRMYEVLGLFILFLVGIMLVSEGGHLGHIALGGYHVEPMAKSTFYFSLIILVIVDLAQSRYKKKLDLERRRRSEAIPDAA